MTLTVSKQFASKHRKNDPDIHPEKYVHPSALRNSNRKFDRKINATRERRQL